MNPVLLASSITPSGASWVEASARASIPSAHIVELADFDDRELVRNVAAAVGVPGASRLSDDLSGALSSIQRVAYLIAAFEYAQSRTDSTVVLVRASVPELVADTCTFSALLRVSAPDSELAARLGQVSEAITEGRIEWLLATPPESGAIDVATIEVAQGCAAGLHIRGVLVAPMPRKSDGWPTSIRRSTQELVSDLKDRLFGVAVKRARGGKARKFAAPAADFCGPSVTEDSSGTFLVSFTLPGARHCDIEVGVWSDDPSYPATHLVVRLEGLATRIALDSTLRRCVAVEAVVAGDTVTVTFVPDPGQWPSSVEEVEG